MSWVGIPHTFRGFWLVLRAFYVIEPEKGASGKPISRSFFGKFAPANLHFLLLEEIHPEMRQAAPEKLQEVQTLTFH